MIHNQYLMQYLSNITQRTVKISNISELSALGSAMNAFQDMSGSKSSASYSPRMKKDVALNYYLDEWHNWIEKMS